MPAPFRSTLQSLPRHGEEAKPSNFGDSGVV
jgi:hypothetical protein